MLKPIVTFQQFQQLAPRRHHLLIDRLYMIVVTPQFFLYLIIAPIGTACYFGCCPRSGFWTAEKKRQKQKNARSADNVATSPLMKKIQQFYFTYARTAALNTKYLI